MKSRGEPTFIDQRGEPLSIRLQQALRNLLPRLRNRFRLFSDELVVAEILEEAGNRIANQESQSGPVANLNAYAWTTVMNIARSRMRRSSARLGRVTVGSVDGATALARLRSNAGTPEHIESNILLQELLAQLTDEEQALCACKRLGLSSREIARKQGTSVAHVDTLFYRIKRKIRSAPPSARRVVSAKSAKEL